MEPLKKSEEDREEGQLYGNIFKDFGNHSLTIPHKQITEKIRRKQLF